LQFNNYILVFECHLLQTTSTTFITLPQSLTEVTPISLQESTINLSSSFSVSSVGYHYNWMLCSYFWSGRVLLILGIQLGG